MAGVRNRTRTGIPICARADIFDRTVLRKLISNTETGFKSFHSKLQTMHTEEMSAKEVRVFVVDAFASQPFGESGSGFND